MDSTEKVARMRSHLTSARPDDEDSARFLQTISSFAPLLSRFLPDDPEELDRYLAVVAQGALSCRSDEAPVLQVHIWNAEGGRWEVLEP